MAEMESNIKLAKIDGSKYGEVSAIYKVRIINFGRY